MKYLREEYYYDDLYDLITIKDCLREKKWIDKNFTSTHKPKRGKPIQVTLDFFTYYIRGERYKRKAETISEWVNRDRARDELVESASPPQRVICKNCSSLMNMTMKHLYDIEDNERVMFWFECPKCKKRRALFNDGQEYKSKPNFCPKCSSELSEKTTKEKDILITKISCLQCNYKITETIDFEKDRREREKEEKKDYSLLQKYRSVYCMTEAQGQEYVSSVENMKQLIDLMKESKKKQNNPAYRKARKAKMLKISRLKIILKKSLEDEKFTNLQFGKPETDRYVAVPFTVEDTDDKREEYSSRTVCKKIIRNALINTNWRLMSEGITYRLGFLKGRIRGYENEDEMADVFRTELNKS